MDLAKLAILKDKLIAAKDFREPWNYFFDHFGEDSEFLKLGQLAKGAKVELLQQVIGKVGQQLFQVDKVLISNMLVTEIKKHHLYHGACFIQGHVATMMFCEDIDMGLIAVALKGNEISLIRFSSVKMEGDKEVFFMPQESTAIN